MTLHLLSGNPALLVGGMSVVVALVGRGDDDAYSRRDFAAYYSQAPSSCSKYADCSGASPRFCKEALSSSSIDRSVAEFADDQLLSCEESMRVLDRCLLSISCEAFASANHAFRCSHDESRLCCYGGEHADEVECSPECANEILNASQHCDDIALAVQSAQDVLE